MDDVTYDVYRTCRTCLKNAELLNGIHDKQDNDISIAEMIMSCTAIIVGFSISILCVIALITCKKILDQR